MVGHFGIYTFFGLRFFGVTPEMSIAREVASEFFCRSVGNDRANAHTQITQVY